MNRRFVIRAAIASYVLIHPVRHLWAKTAQVIKTPWDYEGPFYPVAPPNKTNNLILDTPRADELHLLGKITDVDAQGLADLRIEIWQTDPKGRYKHPNDRRSGERWTDFLYWGETLTEENGSFHFRTYVPGAYGGRPTHIHYKVWRQKKLLLTSQFYFAETGGVNGASRFPRFESQQTSHLIKKAQRHYETHVHVVV